MPVGLVRMLRKEVECLTSSAFGTRKVRCVDVCGSGFGGPTRMRSILLLIFDPAFTAIFALVWLPEFLLLFEENLYLSKLAIVSWRWTHLLN